MKKKFKIEYLIYIYILICPFLDAFSCLYRIWFPSVRFSPVMIIRPMIPLILLIYIFIKEKGERKKLFVSSIIYIIYGVIHLIIFKKTLTGISYGNIFTEALYVFNYTYMIYVLYILNYFNKKNKLGNLKKCLYIVLCEYLALIYISIITKTSLPTYVEGIGYRGWFISGNSLCTILLLLFSCLVDDIFRSKRITNFIIFLLLGVYMIFLVGTRTGMLGFLLVFIFYLVLRILFRVKEKIKNNKLLLIIPCVLIVIVGVSLFKIGSTVLERRKIMNSMSDDIVDINTNSVSHVTGDTSVIVFNIKNYGVDEKYIAREQQKAYLDMYDTCNKLKIKSNNYRVQQLIYNIYLVKAQKNMAYLLFGNGHLNNYGEMILEMEMPYILLNFGIFGFTLYIFPIVSLLFKYSLGDRKKKHNKNYYMYMFGIMLAIALSFIAGYVFYSSTCSLIIISIICLIRKSGESNEKKDIVWNN